jgi:hypothetical protein
MRALVSVAVLCLAFSVSAQTDNNPYRSFPIIITLQFHSLAVPFRNLKSNFSNIGLGVGTEVSLNGKNNWIQQVSVLWYHNRTVGKGIMAYSQNVWRPAMGSNAYSEIKAGAGYLYSFRPVESYKQVEGNWISAGRKGKGMLTLPVGISVGSDIRSSNTYYSPFVSYQFLLAMGYNKSVPIIPMTLMQIGTRIQVNN